MNPLRNDTAKHMRFIHKALLSHGRSEPEPIKDQLDPSEEKHTYSAVMLIGSIVLGCFMLVGGCQVAHAYTVEEVANAIYKTENSKSHPYGVMVHYKHTTPRQACLNTIKRRLSQWDGNGDFIVFLGLKYSPPVINPNWVRLVHYFLNREA